MWCHPTKGLGTSGSRTSRRKRGGGGGILRGKQNNKSKAEKDGREVKKPSGNKRRLKDKQSKNSGWYPRGQGQPGRKLVLTTTEGRVWRDRPHRIQKRGAVKYWKAFNGGPREGETRRREPQMGQSYNDRTALARKKECDHAVKGECSDTCKGGRGETGEGTSILGSRVEKSESRQRPGNYDGCTGKDWRTGGKLRRRPTKKKKKWEWRAGRKDGGGRHSRARNEPKATLELGI